MKKILLTLLCLIAFTSIHADEATLSFADKANRTSFSTSSQVWEQNGIILTNNKGASTSNVADYAKPARFYKSSEIIIECSLGNINSIVFDCNSASYATALKNSITDSNVTVSSDKVTVTLDGTSNSYQIASLTGGQVRMDALTVTYTVSEVPTVARPIITPAGGTYPSGGQVEVSITCATEGATLTYTIDGGEAIEYTVPFAVTESCTIVATATNGTDTKSSEEAVFTFVEPVKFGYVTKVTSGKKYLLVAENENIKKTMTPLTGTYGYINVEDVTPEEGYINMASDVNAITITETEGGYTLQDSNGKYLYQTDTYNSFNVSADMPAEGAVWTIELNNDGTGAMTITNTSVNKWIQYSPSYTSFGSYDSLQENALLPRLYEEGATAMEDPLTGVEDTMVDANAPVEYYNLQGVKVANPVGGIFIKKQGGKATKVVM